jgi:WD40 repeat protein
MLGKSVSTSLYNKLTLSTFFYSHSSHVTNVRFSTDKSRVISIGGADHAIFQWRFIPEDGIENLTNQSIAHAELLTGTRSGSPLQNDTIPEPYQAYLDTDSEESDSELSGREIDSDIEKEKEVSYDRQVYKEDLLVLKPKIKEEIKKAETDLREKRQARPELSLSLKHVFGYRGYDCRDNIFCIKPSGEIVYHVAALGIVYNKETNTQSFYDQHTDDILCLCLHPNKNYVATGQVIFHFFFIFKFNQDIVEWVRNERQF